MKHGGVSFDLYKNTMQEIIESQLEIVDLQRLQIQREIKMENVKRAKKTSNHYLNRNK